MNERAKRDRPAKNPGGMKCEKCEEFFIGEEWHVLCGVCVREIADNFAKVQGVKTPVGTGSQP